MSYRPYAPGTDQFDLDVNYGGLSYDSFFGDGPDCAALPGTPPSASVGADKCGCPSCMSEGWYAQSPICKYWENVCDLCNGGRYAVDYVEGVPVRHMQCQLCVDQWRKDVAWFHFALSDPGYAADLLRSQVHYAKLQARTENLAGLTPASADRARRWRRSALRAWAGTIAIALVAFAVGFLVPADRTVDLVLIGIAFSAAAGLAAHAAYRRGQLDVLEESHPADDPEAR
ncbi:MAG TPA: hypothetical protein VFG15_03350 [Amycolatopsis sp.]|nr:hypothetical protein [Amycolatopsis sp.]